MRINTSSVVDNFLGNKSINRETNDRSAYLRSRDPSMPMHKVAQQYRMDVREARKLSAEVAKLPKAAQKAVLAELAKRATLSQRDMPRMGGLALSENAAAELNKLAKKLGVDTKFASGQPFPIHPVG